MNTAAAPAWLPNLLIPFITLSHPVPPPDAPDSFPDSGYYLPDLLDGCLIITFIAAMAILRDVFRLLLLEPFAQWYLTRGRRRASCDEGNGVSVPGSNGKGNGHAMDASNGDAKSGRVSPTSAEKRDLVRKQKREERIIHRSVLRFAEQGWFMIYYSVIWGYGLFVHCSLPTAPFNPSKVWLGYPHVPLAGPVKLYYLLQTASYTHQIMILNAEARRKDHYQMMAHHIITIALLVLSYFYNFTRIGCLIMVLMDYCDIFLPLAKMFRYLSLPFLCDATFTWFLLSWLITRHILFNLVLRSAYKDLPAVLPFNWAPDEGYYFTRGVHLGFLALLGSLQCLQVLWFGMICRVAWRVISGQGAEDTRSDDEDDADSPTEDTPQNAIPANSGLKKRR